MFEWLFNEQWSPYAAGAGIGVLSWLAFLFSDKHISCSTAVARTGGMIQSVFLGYQKTIGAPYYRKFPPRVEWDWMLFIGIFPGALAASWLSQPFAWSWTPPMWSATFGPNPLLRFAAAFGGGVLMGFASRWAGGCTSGHGISGTMQLAVSSWISVLSFFAGGIAAAFIIYRVFGA